MSTAPAVIPPEDVGLRQEALSWPERARELDVATDEDYEFASATILALKDLRKRIEQHHKPLKDATHQAHQKVCDAERGMLAPLREADDILAPKLRAYLTRKEQERRIQEQQAQERQRLADDEARKADEKRRRDEAAALEAAGDKEAAAEVLAAPPPPPAPPVVIPPSVPKTGVATRSVWKGRIIDVKAFCRGVADGVIPAHLVQVKQSDLDAQARSMKQAFNWPGAEAYEEAGLVRRG